MGGKNLRAQTKSKCCRHRSSTWFPSDNPSRPRRPSTGEHHQRVQTGWRSSCLGLTLWNKVEQRNSSIRRTGSGKGHSVRRRPERGLRSPAAGTGGDAYLSECTRRSEVRRPATSRRTAITPFSMAMVPSSLGEPTETDFTDPRPRELSAPIADLVRGVAVGWIP